MYSGVVQRMATSSPLEQCKSRAQPKFYHYDETYGYGPSPGRYTFTVCPNYLTPDPKKTYEWTATIDQDGARQTSTGKLRTLKGYFSSATAGYLVGLLTMNRRWRGYCKIIFKIVGQYEITHKLADVRCKRLLNTVC